LTPSVVRYTNVGMRYHAVSGETAAVENVTLSVAPGEFLALLGPSGCGKSTLLSLAAGLIFPDEGEVSLFGQRVRGPSQRVGYMLQHDHLFSWRTIEQNALLGLEVRGRVTAAERERVGALLASCGLHAFRHKRPEELSGGMRQRAALVRTLAFNPDLLLLDEPFSALDSQTRVQLGDEVAQRIGRQGCSAMLVTHDVAEAIAMADRIIVLSHRPARIKSQHIVRMEGSPIQRRNHPRFREYFETLWRELDVHVQ